MHTSSSRANPPGCWEVALPASTRVNSVRNDDSGLLLPDEAVAA
jgi:hypothetical protein